MSKICPICGAELVSNYVRETRHLCVGCTKCSYENVVFVDMVSVLCGKAYALVSDMESAIKEIVTNAGKVIRTDVQVVVNDDGGVTYRDTMYGFVMNEELSTNEERKILAVFVKDDELCLLFGFEGLAFDTETDEDIMNDEDNVEMLKGGNVLYSQTLLNICECIEQYL